MNTLRSQPPLVFWRVPFQTWRRLPRTRTRRAILVKRDVRAALFLAARKWTNNSQTDSEERSAPGGRGGRGDPTITHPSILHPASWGNQQPQSRNSSESSVKIGTIQRRLAWPLRKDDTQKSRMYHFLLRLQQTFAQKQLKPSLNNPKQPPRPAHYTPMRSNSPCKRPGRKGGH